MSSKPKRLSLTARFLHADTVRKPAGFRNDPLTNQVSPIETKDHFYKGDLSLQGPHIDKQLHKLTFIPTSI